MVHVVCNCLTLLGTAAQVRNEKARRFLSSMRKKPGVPFEQYFHRSDPAALALLRRLLAFDPAERPSAEEALADPYFTGGTRGGGPPYSTSFCTPVHLLCWAAVGINFKQQRQQRLWLPCTHLFTHCCVPSIYVWSALLLCRSPRAS